jgi:hypothetical protein
MKCSDLSKSVPLYLAGELQSGLSAELTAHLRSCAACRCAFSEAADDVALDELVRASVFKDYVDHAAVDRRVRAGIHSEQRAPRRLIAVAAGIAAVLAVTIAAWRITVSAHANPVYAAAARDYRLELIQKQPRKWFTDRDAIARLAGRVGLPSATVTAFAPAGYRLAEGKLCFLDGRVFLHLVYASEHGDFSLFLRRPDDGSIGSGSIHADHFAAEQVAGFQHAQLSALLVTDQSALAALQLATSAAAML